MIQPNRSKVVQMYPRSRASGHLKNTVFPRVYAQTHVNTIDVYKSFQWVLFVATLYNADLCNISSLFQVRDYSCGGE